MNNNTGTSARRKLTPAEKEQRRIERPQRYEQTVQALKEYYTSLAPGYSGEKVTPVSLDKKYEFVNRSSIKR